MPHMIQETNGEEGRRSRPKGKNYSAPGLGKQKKGVKTGVL